MSVVFNVTQLDFKQKVIEASREKPVAVDFWAPWCSPCRTLGPILERVILSYGGTILLAKVDIEENHELAVEWGIQTIPIVKIFRDGKVHGEFIGALPETKLRSLLEGYIPSRADELALQAKSLLEKGALEAAEATYYQVLQMDPHHPEALFRLAEISLGKGEREKAAGFARSIDMGEKRHDAAQQILARIEFLETCDAAGNLETCETAVENNPQDLDARYHYGLCLAARKDYPKALDQLLFILEKDREFKDKAAHRAVLSIFSIIGEESEYIDQYRSRLSMILFS